MHLKDGMGNKKGIGLLDFQDAMLSHPSYDLVSLLEDARYDVPEDLRDNMIDYYLSLQPHLDKESFLLAYHILGAQRNSRILGYFARKKLRDGDDKYMKFVPRVRKYLMNDLAHPALQRLRPLYNDVYHG